MWTEAALPRGDKVAVTARQLASRADLTEKYGVNALPLDVTNPEQARTAVAQAHAHCGRRDVVPNNAGYALVGTIEEARPDDIRAQDETTILGPFPSFRPPCLSYGRRAATTFWALPAA